MDELIKDSKRLQFERVVVAALEWLIRERVGDKPSDYTAGLLDDLNGLERSLREESQKVTLELAAKVDAVWPKCPEVHPFGLCAVCRGYFD